MSARARNGVVAVVVCVVATACGTTDEASRQTLPPMETTTTTTTTTTTIPQERFYEIQPGDSLSAIAAARPGVEVVDILNANPDLANENAIEAGDVIVIPLPGGTGPTSEGAEQSVEPGEDADTDADADAGDGDAGSES